MAFVEQKQPRKNGLTAGKVAVGTVLLAMAGSLAYKGYDGFLGLQPHIGTNTFLPYVEDHLHKMTPFMIGRTIDMGSTLFAMNAFVASGTPREDVHKNELGLFARREFRLWYRENKKAYALANAIGVEALLWSAAFAFPDQWNWYLPAGIFLGVTNSLQGMYSLEQYKKKQKTQEEKGQDFSALPAYPHTWIQDQTIQPQS